MATNIADYTHSKEFQTADAYQEIQVTVTLMVVAYQFNPLLESILNSILLSNPASLTDYDVERGPEGVIYTNMNLRGPKYAVTPFLTFASM